jgi:hypothetical protein
VGEDLDDDLGIDDGTGFAGSGFELLASRKPMGEETKFPCALPALRARGSAAVGNL